MPGSAGRFARRAADLVVGRAKLRRPSESVSRFDAWLSHQAANVSRWAAEIGYNHTFEVFLLSKR
jgi:hypothetical protein